VVLKFFYQGSAASFQLTERHAIYLNVRSVYMPPPSFNTILKRFDGSIGRALYDAAAHGRTHILKILFENGVDLNYKCDFCYDLSLLHIAAKMPSNQKALKYLLESGATLFIDDMQNQFGLTPLMVACSNGSASEELAMLLLKFGADAKCKKTSKGSRGYTAYDFLLKIREKEFKPSPEFIEVLRVATF